MRTECCAHVSLAGVVFLSSLGGILQLQPEYIRGLTHATPAAKLATNCWVGAAIYATTWLICLAALKVQGRQESSLKKKSYDLQELRRAISSWEDLGMPPRLDGHEGDDEDQDDNVAIGGVRHNTKPANGIQT
ncbi:hypothetical protein H257_12916 [Aphanomyces astaci]|uniref:Uncharacterized protein n=1 Tax=Aphanomyces astaci TaxID=112090 RepID=W4FW50_APHAT|nr:hypothetical protein H257_12916 [Aphanomyces astaci]ETV71755.1 hypothetical protein H257_12916 [Aphanomyces astaci]KAF0755591.1 hypothetical protein AaE_004913 [Aphanomyces astaci]|eukprot:XP_009838604.1 hypothetical protein H257_12916 [Aphanomyces astaci]